MSELATLKTEGCINNYFWMMEGKCFFLSNVGNSSKNSV